MLPAGLEIFLQMPEERERRILHAATVLGMNDGMHTAEVEECGLELPPGRDILVYFERRGQFMQQPARVEVVLSNEPRTVVAFELTGEPVSAESRQCFRVATVVAGLTATIDGSQCALTDVSANGFSVISAASLTAGKSVSVEVEFENKKYKGPARIQSLKALPSGKTRYGLFCTSDSRGQDNLGQGLQRISTAIQRQQLRRASGA